MYKLKGMGLAKIDIYQSYLKMRYNRKLSPIKVQEKIVMELLSFLHKIKNLFLITLIASNISPCNALTPNHMKVIGQVVWAKGTVKAALPNAKPRRLARRSEVYEHDTLMSDPAGTGEIVFTDNSVLSLRENSIVQIDKYTYNKGAAPGKDTFVANVAKGGFRTVTGAISKNNPGGYKATTPVAIIGVSGTRYSIYFDPAKNDMAAKLDQGAISISNPQGQVTLQKCSGGGSCVNQVYAQVKGPDVAPVTVTQEPAVFKVEPPLTTTNGFPDSGATSTTTESSPSSTDTGTDTSTDTGTDTSTDTDTGTDTGTDTSTDTGTDTSTDTGTDTSTDTGTDTSTATSTGTSTDTSTGTGTGTATSTDTGTDTNTTTTKSPQKNTPTTVGSFCIN
jgi:hypothetical protein